MNPFLLQIVNQKINSLTAKDLLQLATQHQIQLSIEQSKKIITILRTEKIDVNNEEQVNRIISRLQTEVDPYVSQVVAQLLEQYNQYLP